MKYSLIKKFAIASVLLSSAASFATVRASIANNGMDLQFMDEYSIVTAGQSVVGKVPVFKNEPGIFGDGYIKIVGDPKYPAKITKEELKRIEELIRLAGDPKYPAKISQEELEVLKRVLRLTGDPKYPAHVEIEDIIEDLEEARVILRMAGDPKYPYRTDEEEKGESGSSDQETAQLYGEYPENS